MLWLLYEWVEHSLVQYETTTVECQKLSQNTEFRLCLISDLHNNKKNLQKLVTQVHTFAPEVILIAGDLVNKHKKKNLFAEQFLEAIAKTDIPVFYSAGNHELSLTEDYPKEWTEFLSGLPKTVTYLENSSLLLDGNRKIRITGLSLPRIFYKKGRLHHNEEDLPEIETGEHGFHILLAHHPEYANLYKKYDADFIVSGHLHGGLLRLPFIGGVVSPRFRLPKGYDAGLVPLDNGSQMFISRGLGSHTVPLRFFNRVEVNFIVLKGTKE